MRRKPAGHADHAVDAILPGFLGDVEQGVVDPPEAPCCERIIVSLLVELCSRHSLSITSVGG